MHSSVHGEEEKALGPTHGKILIVTVSTDAVAIVQYVVRHLGCQIL